MIDLLFGKVAVFGRQLGGCERFTVALNFRNVQASFKVTDVFTKQVGNIGCLLPARIDFGAQVAQVKCAAVEQTGRLLIVEPDFDQFSLKIAELAAEWNFFLGYLLAQLAEFSEAFLELLLHGGSSAAEGASGFFRGILSIDKP